MATAYLCDFDGTVAPHDIGASLVRRFARGHEPELREALARWKARTQGGAVQGDDVSVESAA